MVSGPMDRRTFLSRLGVGGVGVAGGSREWGQPTSTTSPTTHARVERTDAAAGRRGLGVGSERAPGPRALPTGRRSCLLRCGRDAERDADLVPRMAHRVPPLVGELVHTDASEVGEAVGCLRGIGDGSCHPTREGCRRGAR